MIMSIYVCPLMQVMPFADDMISDKYEMRDYSFIVLGNLGFISIVDGTLI